MTTSSRHGTGGSRSSRPAESGFTLLEIMLALALVGVSVVPVLLVREQSHRQSQQARVANLARLKARELLSEFEFHGLDTLSGEFDDRGLAGFRYDIEVEEIDLVTGDEEDDEYDPDDKSGSKFYKGPADSVFATADEEEDEGEYPVRRVTLTLTYPNLSSSGSDEPRKLTIETIFPALPEKDKNGNFNTVK